MKNILLLMLVFVGHCTSAQLSGLKVRKSFESKTGDDSKPALATFTIPKGEKNHFVINAGVGYDFMTTRRTNKNGNAIKHVFNGFFVYNLNTQIEKKQKNYKVGVTSNQVFELDQVNAYAIFGANTLQYLKDFKDSTNSLLVTSYWSPSFKKSDNSLLHIGGYPLNNHLFNYYFLPTIGVEYQKIIETKMKDENTKGDAFRGYFNIQGNLMIKKRTAISKRFWQKGVELVASYTGRQAFTNTIAAHSDYTSFSKIELDFFPATTDNFSIGISHNSGTNIMDGLKKQTFWLLTLQFQI